MRLGTYYYGLITLAFELSDLEKNKIGDNLDFAPLIYIIYIYL